MHKKLTSAALIASAFLILATEKLQAQPAASNPFTWLEGYWMMKDSKSEFHETWTSRSDNLLLGTGVMIVKGDTVMHERIRLEKTGGNWVYSVSIGEEAPIQFTLLDSKTKTLIFENKAHDFPQRIGYERKADGTLNAWIEGNVEGNNLRKDFPMVKVQ